MDSHAKILMLLAALVLALSLSAQSVSAGPVLKLTLFDTQEFPNAICNDGSPSGYYYAPATTQPNRWVFHLEGGWWCWDDKSCTGRAKSSPGMVSSTSWSSTRYAGGIFDADPLVTPDWYGVNLVYMPYCSSDAWAGDGNGVVNGTNWNFRGRSVVEAVFNTFFAKQSVSVPQEILFTGCSAGGQGLLYNVDTIRTLVMDLTPSGTRFKGFADAGWMMDFPSIRNPTTEIHTQFEAGWKLWAPRDNLCSLVNPIDPFNCFFSPNAIGYISTPTLIQSSSYDAFQMPYDCCSPPFNPNNLGLSSQLASDTRKAMRALIHPPHSVYSPTCYTHCLSLDRNFNNVQIHSTSLNSKLSNWFFDRLPDLGPLVDDCVFNCSTRCS